MPVSPCLGGVGGFQAVRKTVRGSALQSADGKNAHVPAPALSSPCLPWPSSCRCQAHDGTWLQPELGDSDSDSSVLRGVRRAPAISTKQNQEGLGPLGKQSLGE